MSDQLQDLHARCGRSGHSLRENPAQVGGGTSSPLTSVREVQVSHHADFEVPDFPRVEKVVEVLRRRPPGRLLDVGYARGGFSDYLAKSGWRCVGLDLNKRPAGGVATVQCDLNQGFPVKSASFDAVVAGEIIEHMLDEGAFLDECHRVLRREGILALTTPNLAFLVNRVLVLCGRPPLFVFAPYHYHFHTRQTLVKLVEAHSFKVETVIASHVLYSRRRHASGRLFERIADWCPSLGAHLIVFARPR